MSARRDWFAVQCRLVRHPKFRRLTDPAQLALVYVWAIAGDETPEATWRTVDHLALALQIHGRDPATLAELRATGWLDTLEDGTVVCHDWDDHQIYASREIKNAWEAARLRTWRKARHASSPSSSSTEETVQERTTYVQGTDDGRTEEARKNGTDARTTCPRCGDLLDDKSPNVVVTDHGRQLWHRACPGDGSAGLNLSAEWSAP